MSRIEQIRRMAKYETHSDDLVLMSYASDVRFLLDRIEELEIENERLRSARPEYGLSKDRSDTMTGTLSTIATPTRWMTIRSSLAARTTRWGRTDGRRSQTTPLSGR